LWFMVSEVLVHGWLTPLLWASVRQEIVTEQSDPLQMREGERERERMNAGTNRLPHPPPFPFFRTPDYWVMPPTFRQGRSSSLS
jgi:hypothetical protein